MQQPLTAAQRNRITIQVYGLPAPQGSKRLVGRGRATRMVEASRHLPAWRKAVTAAARAALEQHPDWNRDHQYVTMHVTFSLPRPRLHYRTGRFANLLREDAPVHHARTPDLDKLVRGICDALTAAGVYADDSRVAQVLARKCYASAASLPPGVLDRPGARIVLTGGTDTWAS